MAETIHVCVPQARHVPHHVHEHSDERVHPDGVHLVLVFIVCRLIKAFWHKLVDTRFQPGFNPVWYPVSTRFGTRFQPGLIPGFNPVWYPVSNRVETG